MVARFQIKVAALKRFVCLIVWIPLDLHALDKCELPLQYLKESTEYQSNNNVKQADEHFDIGLSLHHLLIHECDSVQYRKSINTLIRQHTVNQRALCSSGVRQDCYRNTNRMKKFGE